MTDKDTRFTDAASKDRIILCGVCELDGFSESFPSIEARHAHYDESGHMPIEEWFATQAVKRTFLGTTQLSMEDKLAAQAAAPTYRAPGAKLHGRDFGPAHPMATAKQVKFAKDLGISVVGQTAKRARTMITEALEAKKAQELANVPVATPVEQANEVRDLIKSMSDEPAVKAIQESLNNLRAQGALTPEKITVALDALRTIRNAPRANTAGNHDHPQTPSPSRSMPSTGSPVIKRKLTNRYESKCVECNTKVEIGEGWWMVDDSGTKTVTHKVCPTPVDLPVGRYAVTHEDVLKFYHVTPSGLFVMASSDEHHIKSQDYIDQIVELVKVDPWEAMRRYGEELGQCARCNRTLTDAESRSHGLGPICYGKSQGEW